MDLSNLTIRDFLTRNYGEMHFNVDLASDAPLPRPRASSGLSSHGCDNGFRDDDDYPLFESSTQVVKYLFENDEAPVMPSENRAESSSSSYDVDKELFDADAASPTFFMPGSPENGFDKVDPNLVNGLRMETSFSSKSSNGSNYGDHGYVKYMGGRSHRDFQFSGLSNGTDFFNADSFMDGGVGDGRRGSYEFGYQPMDLLGSEANKLMSQGNFEKLQNIELVANGEPSNQHGKNLLTNEEQQAEKMGQGKKPPNLPNLVLNNLSNSSTPSGYPYPYSNVAGAIKSPNPKDGLLGESPFHVPGVLPPGYVPNAMGGFGVVPPGAATVNGRQIGQGIFQFPTAPETWMQNTYYGYGGHVNSTSNNINAVPFVMQKSSEKYPPVVPVDRASAKAAPDLTHGLLPLCEELDSYPGPNRLKKFAAVRHIRRCDKADQLEIIVDLAEYLLHCLERERQQVESDLSRRYPGKRINSAPSATMTQYVAPGGNHCRLDKLIVECTNEHTKVMTILGKIEGILGHPVHPDVREDIGEFKMAVVRLQNARKHEITVSTKLHDEGVAHNAFGRSVELKAFEGVLFAVEDLQIRARSAWTALYGAYSCVLFRDVFPDLSDATFLPTSQFNRLMDIAKERKRNDSECEAHQGRKLLRGKKKLSTSTASTTSSASLEHDQILLLGDGEAHMGDGIDLTHF